MDAKEPVLLGKYDLSPTENLKCYNKALWKRDGVTSQFDMT